MLAGEELSQEEDQFTHQDGRTDWVRWSMVPWRRADGNIGGALLFAELRTEQVEARRALTDSEARFRATFENAAVGVALVGSDGSILRANNSFARMLGYSVEELKTRTFQDLTHPDDLATNLSVFNKTLVGEAESYCIEKRYVRKDGGIVWASLTVGCVRKTDGGVDYFVSVVEDITDRKRAEARLAERNAQLDLAGKIARIGSFMYDDGTKKLQLSPGCAAIYGLPEGTLEISREDWRARVHPDDLAAVGRRRSAARSLMANESSSWNFGYSATVRCGGSSRVSSSHTTKLGSQYEGSEPRSTLLSANRRNRHWPSATYSLPWQQRLASLVPTRMTPTRRSCRFLPAMRPSTAFLKALPR